MQSGIVKMADWKIRAEMLMSAEKCGSSLVAGPSSTNEERRIVSALEILTRDPVFLMRALNQKRIGFWVVFFF